MTAWTDITNPQVAAGAALNTALMTALRDNPSAIAEADETAATPVNQAMWHPYDMVVTNDGNDGLYYDQAVDGTVASVETPAFDDGYEYRIFGDGLSISANTQFQLELYKATDAAYAPAETITPVQASATFDATFICDIHHAMMLSTGHLVTVNYVMQNGDDGVQSAGIWDATLQKISKARISCTAGNIDEGKLWLYRRRILGVGG